MLPKPATARLAHFNDDVRVAIDAMYAASLKVDPTRKAKRGWDMDKDVLKAARVVYIERQEMRDQEQVCKGYSETDADWGCEIESSSTVISPSSAQLEMTAIEKKKKKKGEEEKEEEEDTDDDMPTLEPACLATEVGILRKHLETAVESVLQSIRTEGDPDTVRREKNTRHKRQVQRGKGVEIVWRQVTSSDEKERG